MTDKEYCLEYMKTHNISTVGYDNWRDLAIDIMLEEEKEDEHI